MPNCLLSLDLGLSSGWAILAMNPREGDLGLIAHGVCHIKTLESTLREIKLAYLPRKRVVEDPIIIRGALGDTLEEAKRIANRQLHPFDKWLPSQWKNHPLAKTPCPRGISPHERDAIRLGIVYRALVDN